MPRQRLLDGGVPRFHIGVLKALINDKICGCFRGVSDDPVWRNRRLNEPRETVLESSGSYSIREHCRPKGGNRWVKLIVRPDGKVIGVAVVWEWRIADAKSRPEDC